MGSVRLIPGLESVVERTPEMEAACMDVAGKVATRAQDIAGREAYRTGAYQQGIIAAVGESGGRLVAQVQGTDFKSRWIEFGFTSEGTTRPPKAILRRAAEAAGYHVQASRP